MPPWHTPGYTLSTWFNAQPNTKDPHFTSEMTFLLWGCKQKIIIFTAALSILENPASANRHTSPVPCWYRRVPCFHCTLRIPISLHRWSCKQWGVESSRSASEFAAMQHSAGFFSRKGSSAGSDAEGVAEKLQKEPSRWLQPCQLTMAKYWQC